MPIFSLSVCFAAADFHSAFGIFLVVVPNIVVVRLSIDIRCVCVYVHRTQAPMFQHDKISKTNTFASATMHGKHTIKWVILELASMNTLNNISSFCPVPLSLSLSPSGQQTSFFILFTTSIYHPPFWVILYSTCVSFIRWHFSHSPCYHPSLHDSISLNLSPSGFFFTLSSLKHSFRLPHNRLIVSPLWMNEYASQYRKMSSEFRPTEECALVMNYAKQNATSWNDERDYIQSRGSDRRPQCELWN